MNPAQALADLWTLGQMPLPALVQAQLTGADPVLPSSFAVGTAAQSTIAAAALAACEVGHERGQPRQTVAVDMAHAALECTSWFSVNGVAPELWDAFSGLYRCSDGWVRMHANFAHHRDGALHLLGLDPANATRAQAEKALLNWKAQDFEAAAAQHGLVVAALRSFEDWDAHPQGQAVALQSLLSFERIGDAAPLDLPPITEQALPLAGVKVLELTRILAGPVAGRSLATYGADVLLLNSPHLPNIAAIADTSRGKRSAHVDLHTDAGRAALRQLVSQAHVWLQGYRPGGLDALGFLPKALAQLRPGIVCVSLSAYGHTGPWADRRGFDSLVQTAMGFNQAEAQAAGSSTPKAMPMQILDHASGYLMAFAASAALWRQQREGGSWHVRVALARTGHWLRSLGRVQDGFAVKAPELAPYLESGPSGFGELCGVRHSAQLERTPARRRRPSMPPGSHAPVWD